MAKRTFRVTGDARFAFIHTIEADSAEEADDLVAQLKMSQLDTVDSVDIQTDGCVEIDPDTGEEIE